MAAHQSAPDASWPVYGADVYGTRYSPLSQITRHNVPRLEVAWTYRTGELAREFATREETALEVTPLVVDGTMYVSTPLGRVIALDPATGAERWVFDPRIDRTVEYGDFTNRGVATWMDSAAPPGAPCRRRIYVAVIDGRLIALDAGVGRPCRDFGASGVVDLKTGLRVPPFEPAAYEVTSPPTVVNGLVITGSAIADNSRLAPASGEVRAFDARSGAPRWTWDPIPQDPADPAYETWQDGGGGGGGGGSARRTGGANAWSVLAADPARDLVIVPTSSPAPDYFGGLRKGSNRYANSVVALRASTGAVVWHFQTVHHDLWDYDNA
ncbi:MAG TPA: PQQ-binding-like beta-propeller repeat protein, partial [Gemmatimonadales bacterium]|nr:PQQ-binding-like beta-propeller repeat protein [Gemmatimonadales bacterium]